MNFSDCFGSKEQHALHQELCAQAVRIGELLCSIFLLRAPALVFSRSRSCGYFESRRLSLGDRDDCIVVLRPISEKPFQVGNQAESGKHSMLGLAGRVIHFIHHRHDIANYFSNFACGHLAGRLHIAFACGSELHRHSSKDAASQWSCKSENRAIFI